MTNQNRRINLGERDVSQGYNQGDSTTPLGQNYESTRTMKFLQVTTIRVDPKTGELRRDDGSIIPNRVYREGVVYGTKKVDGVDTEVVIARRHSSSSDFKSPSTGMLEVIVQLGE